MEWAENKEKIIKYGALAAVVLGGAYVAWRFSKGRSGGNVSEKTLFDEAFPSGEDQPIALVREKFLHHGQVNAHHLDFWLFVADQNTDGKISREEFSRVVRWGAFRRFGEQWEEDMRHVVFRVLDTDHDGCVDRDELFKGLQRLYQALKLQRNAAQDTENVWRELKMEPNDTMSDEEWKTCSVALQIINTKTIAPLFQ